MKDPVLQGGVVLPGGSLCLDFLTTNWNPVWTLEMAMQQIVVALVNVRNESFYKLYVINCTRTYDAQKSSLSMIKAPHKIHAKALGRQS